MKVITSPTRKVLGSRQYIEGGGGVKGGKRGGLKGGTNRRDRDVKGPSKSDTKGNQRT